MIVRINNFHAADGKARDLLDYLASVIAIVHEAPGCERCELVVDADDATRIVIIEKWTSIAAHQAAASRISPDQLAAVRPLLAGPPSGHYYEESDRG